MGMSFRVCPKKIYSSWGYICPGAIRVGSQEKAAFSNLIEMTSLSAVISSMLAMVI